ncbi:radical SAM protein [Candidatus Bathyarchaeota archaeon]|nr:radical SAM protein [Candidatus Bathyarchaeota archaeon]
MNKSKVIRETISVCPVCLKKVKAKIVEENGKVLLKKSCTLHGNFNDVYWANAELYHWAEDFAQKTSEIKPFSKQPLDKCPYDCGLCSLHASKTVMAVIDVTNECDLKCPICFANSPNMRSIYEPTKENIRRMLRFLKKQDPPPPAVMFSGGEPTVRDDIVEIVNMAHDLRFMVLLATNGLKMAQNPKMVKNLKNAGLNIVYLQFDGLTNPPYEKLRGTKLLQKKLKLIKLCRDSDIEIVLVPTVHGGINDNEIGDIIRFAAENVDIIRGIVFQPMSFTGRTGNLVSSKNRICNSLLAKRIEEQTAGKISEKDLFPVSLMVPPIKVMSNFVAKSWPLFTPTPYCGLWNWVLISKQSNGLFTPINRFLNFDVFMSDLNAINRTSNNQRIGKISIYLKLLFTALRSLDWRKIQQEAGLINTVKMLIKIHTKPSYGSLGDIRRRLLLIGCMAFMDPYNFDIERAKRCVIHYVTPDLRLIPFCAYNIFYRSQIEQMYSTANQDSITSNRLLHQLPE